MKEAVVEVRMRGEHDATAKPFTLWPASDLEGVVKLIDRWGIEDEEGTESIGRAFGQFRVGPDGAYFEVVIPFGE